MHRETRARSSYSFTLSPLGDAADPQLGHWPKSPDRSTWLGHRMTGDAGEMPSEVLPNAKLGNDRRQSAGDDTGKTYQSPMPSPSADSQSRRRRHDIRSAPAPSLPVPQGRAMFLPREDVTGPQPP